MAAAVEEVVGVLSGEESPARRTIMAADFLEELLDLAAALPPKQGGGAQGEQGGPWCWTCAVMFGLGEG